MDEYKKLQKTFEEGFKEQHKSLRELKKITEDVLKDLKDTPKVLIGANHISVEELKERYADALEKNIKQQRKGFAFIMNFIMYDPKYEIKIPKFKGNADKLRWYKKQLEI